MAYVNIVSATAVGETVWAETWYTGSSSLAFDDRMITSWTYEGLGWFQVNLGFSYAVTGIELWQGGHVSNGNFFSINVNGEEVIREEHQGYYSSWDFTSVRGDSVRLETLAVAHNEYLQIASWSEISEIKIKFDEKQMILGSSANDRFLGSSSNEKVAGRNGNDTLYGGSGNDKLYGGSGNDRSYGEAGNDSLYMDAGNDTLDGGSGADWLYVTGRTNSVVNLAKTTGQNTGYGTDIIKNIENASGGSGVDKFYGTSGNNTLKGNNGNDLLYGQNGNDTLYGGNNNDKLYGGSGNDTLRGDAGRDILQGDGGKDTLFGGADADTFVFRKTSDSSASASGADIIRDFKHGQDKIDLHYIDASTKLSGNNEFTFDGTKSFGTSNEGDIYYKQFNNAGTSNDYTMVYIDTDNDTAAEMSIKLMGLHALTASDFIL